ncbi:MAG: 2-amino-3,7-dideoxy-D-threo-hept-6-ulosonate synthase [Candidatus Bathyarchaeia archaeon]
MSVGKERRLRRILREDRRAVIVPMDHGVSSGPIQGIEDMQKIVDKLRAGRADAIIIHRGIARRVDIGGLGLIVHLSASTSIGVEPTWKVKVCSVEEALRLGADAVSIHVNVGSTHEAEMLSKMGEVSDCCERFGVPLLAMMYPRGPNIKDEHDPKLVRHVARLGAELGADLIKVPYTGSLESFREVVESCPAPVIIAGGPKARTDREVLEMVYDSIQVGGAGVSIGRNIFQHADPAAMVRALSAIVHKRATVEEALKIIGGAP